MEVNNFNKILGINNSKINNHDPFMTSVKRKKLCKICKKPKKNLNKGSCMGCFSKQLKMGIKMEMEHTDNPVMAEKIALDHLREDPKYYSKIKMLKS